MDTIVTELDERALAAYRGGAKARSRALQERLEARRKRAWEVARRAASILKAEYGVTRVAGFGSLAHAHLFHLRSDVDLAAWGLNERDYYRAVGVLQSLDPAIGVDLVAFEDAKPALKDVILRDGVSL